MRILTRSWAGERMPAWAEAYAGLRNDASQRPLRGKGRAFGAASRLAGGQIALVAMLPGERRRGQPESGGGGSRQSVL
jgi:hypothetical protein